MKPLLSRVGKSTNEELRQFSLFDTLFCPIQPFDVYSSDLSLYAHRERLRVQS
jgi:hypothetical protein